MKQKLHPLAALMAFMLVFSFCKEKDEMQADKGEPMKVQRYFKTPAEAATKAKEDLIKALESNKNLNTGINLDQFKKARQAAMIEYKELDFAKILSMEKADNLDQLVRSNKATIVPFVLDGRVAGIVEIQKSQEGWEITGLANKSLKDDLNASGLIREQKNGITVYEVPNLQLRVYSAPGMLRRTVYYLNFENLRINDGVSISTLYPILRKKAIEFERLYGKELKEKKLVD